MKTEIIFEEPVKQIMYTNLEDVVFPLIGIDFGQTYKSFVFVDYTPTDKQIIRSMNFAELNTETLYSAPTIREYLREVKMDNPDMKAYVFDTPDELIQFLAS